MIYNLQPYKQGDYDFVFNVKKVCYKRYVEENFGEWDDDVQYEMFDSFLKTSAKDIFVICVGDEKIGFVNGLNVDDETYEQGNICILPEYQNQGIGTKILKDIFEQHKNQTIKLRVFKQNPAKSLYERLGFVVCGETKSHFIMEKVQKDS